MTTFQDLKDKFDVFLSHIRRVYKTITSFFLLFLEHMQTHTLDDKPRKN